MKAALEDLIPALESAYPFGWKTVTDDIRRRLVIRGSWHNGYLDLMPITLDGDSPIDGWSVYYHCPEGGMLRLNCSFVGGSPIDAMRIWVHDCQRNLDAWRARFVELETP